MSKKITILLLAFMLTACSNANSSDSKAESQADSKTTTTTASAYDDSSEVTTSKGTISAKEIESETTTSKVTSGSQSTTADSTMSTTTTTAKASQTTTVSGKAPASSVQRQQPKPTATTTTITTTTTTAAVKPQPQSNVVWSSSMKVWRKLCEAKTLTAAEQEMIRSEIASYAAKFQGKTKIHVSFGNDSFDITYPKPILMTRKKDMVDWTTNAHFDASVDMDCRGIINYAKSEKQIYDVVSQTRNDALGLHSRYEISKLNNCLEYANVIQYNVGFDGTYLWFLTQD